MSDYTRVWIDDTRFSALFDMQSVPRRNYGATAISYTLQFTISHI